MEWAIGLGLGLVLSRASMEFRASSYGILYDFLQFSGTRARAIYFIWNFLPVTIHVSWSYLWSQIFEIVVSSKGVKRSQLHPSCT